MGCDMEVRRLAAGSYSRHVPSQRRHLRAQLINYGEEKPGCQEGVECRSYLNPAVCVAAGCPKKEGLIWSPRLSWIVAMSLQIGESGDYWWPKLKAAQEKGLGALNGMGGHA
jgi:hypothetical protein